MGNQETDNSPYSPRTGIDDSTVSLLDIVAVIVKRRWLILGITIVAAVLILLVLVSSMLLPTTSQWNILPNKYKPTVMILLQPVDQSSSFSSLINQSGLSALSGLVGTSAKLGGTSSDLVLALLKTNSILDQVASEFGFSRRFKLGVLPKTAARGIITNALSTKDNAASGTMEIGFENVDKEFATQVVNRLVELVGKEFTNLSVSKILDKENYLATQLDATQKEADRQQANLLAFQNKYGVYDVTQQTGANIQAIEALRAQIVTMQINLNSQSKYLPDTDYRIVQLKDQIQETQKAIDALTQGSGADQAGVVPQKQLLSLGAQYQNLLRDLTVQQAIVSTLKSQYEAAKVDEMTKAQAFQIVEQAEVPEVRSSPHRSRVALIAVVTAGLLGILLAFVLEYIDRAKRDPVEAGKLALIRSSLAPRRRSRRG